MSARIAYLSFTEKGDALARTLAAALGGEADYSRRISAFSLSAWTREAFASRDAIVFVGAVGIAVRAIAPLLRSKAHDPAVVAVDECGRFAVPLASGHLGGANALAWRIAGVCGATPVITTATDANGVFAVDSWAKRQNCAIPDVGRIKTVSAKLLAGGTIGVRSAVPIAGAPPQGVVLRDADADVAVDFVRCTGAALQVVPRGLVLGVGCRRGTPAEALEAAFSAMCEALSLCPEAICAAASIDLKANEEGLLAFCAAHRLPVTFYSAAQLREAPGAFTASAFVERQTGVDNVCERSAVLAANGPLWEKKRAGGGVTMALAQKPLQLDWSWNDG